VKRIYIACLDPNPLVSGKGVEQLRAAGIEIELGLAEDKAKQLNEMFFHYITTKRPFVIAKWAMSLDGKTITNPGDSRQISNSETQQHTHRTRAQVDAILIGANTAITDNPLLTVRLADNDNKEGHITKQPVRIILSTNSKLPVDLKMFDKKMPGKTIIATTNAMDPARVKIFRDKAIEVIILPQDENNRVDLKKLLEELGKRHITSLLVEGGMKIHESFFEKKLINKVSVYMAPIIIGTLVEKQKIPNLDLVQMGSDFYFTADFKEDKDV